MTLSGFPWQVSAAWMRLTPRAPTASCCSWAVLSSMRMWIRIWLGGSLPWYHRTIGHEHQSCARSSTYSLSQVGHPSLPRSHYPCEASPQSFTTIFDEKKEQAVTANLHCQFGRQQKDRLSRTWVMAPHCFGRSWYLIPSQPWHSLFLLNALAVTVSANAKKAVSRPLSFRSVRLTCSQQRTSLA